MFLFKSRGFDPLSFERTIQKVSGDITRNERAIARLRGGLAHHHRRVPFHCVAVYVAYFSYEYYAAGGHRWDLTTIMRLVGLAVALVGLYVALKCWFEFKINRRVRWGDQLKERHAELLAQLKEKTNFDKTRDLLVRYGDGEDIKLMEQEMEEVRAKKEKYKAMLAEADSKGDAKAQIMADLKNEARSPGYYQMMIDALLGDDETSPDHRYALICSDCGQHNGLAPPGKRAEEIHYICPRCGKEHNPKVKDAEQTG